MKLPALNREHPVLQTMKFFYFCVNLPIFVDLFCPPGYSLPKSMRIRINNTELKSSDKILLERGDKTMKDSWNRETSFYTFTT